jgi:hypothetical protein
MAVITLPISPSVTMPMMTRRWPNKSPHLTARGVKRVPNRILDEVEPGDLGGVEVLGDLVLGVG